MSINRQAPRRAKFDLPEIPEQLDAKALLGQEAAIAQGAIPDGFSESDLTLPHPEQTRIFVVANQKGGVGKTTSTVNIAAALALGGLKVLVIDIDPQGNASTALGVEHTSGTISTYEVLTGEATISDAVQSCPDIANLYCVPATIDLAGCEIGLVSTPGREAKLADALELFLAEYHLDYIFIDCPPSLGLLTLNALVAAKEILVPIQCEYYALEGVTQLLNTINLVKGNLNDDLELTTVLLTMYDGRTLLSSQVAAEVREHLPNQALSAAIPRSVRIAEAPSYGQTIFSYQPQSAGAKAYRAAAQEISQRG